jgi:hypothetical protein
MANVVDQIADILREKPESAKIPEETPNPEAGEDTAEMQSETPDTGAEIALGSEKETPSGVEEGVDRFTLVDLAKAIEVEPEYLYGVQIPLPDGEEPVTIGQMKDQWKEMRKVQVDSKKYESERSELIAQQEKLKQELMAAKQTPQMPYNQKMVEAEAIVLAIANEYQTTDWQTLERNDPARAALKRQKLTEAMEVANTHRNNLMVQTMQAAQNERMQEVQQEVAKARASIDGWSDEKKFQQDWSEMASTMKEYGFGDHEIGSVFDARTQKMLHDFVKLRQASKEGKAKLQNVQPKPLKPKATGAPVVGAARISQIIKQAAASKSIKEKAAGVSEILRIRGIT